MYAGTKVLGYIKHATAAKSFSFKGRRKILNGISCNSSHCTLCDLVIEIYSK